MRTKKNLCPPVITLLIILYGNIFSYAGNKSDLSNPGYYNVIEFGAKADGIEKDTYHVQEAIDSCFSHGGGTVYFPPGKYLCGSLHLKSNVALYLDHGSIIIMSKENVDFDSYEALNFKNDADRETSYFHYSLIWGEDIEHVAIFGTGTIDGNREKRGGPKPIALKRCKDISIKDITIKNAPNYAISMLGTDFVNISGVSILNGHCDGIDPDASQNIRISDCFIDCYDDAIVPKSSFALGYRRAVENLTVTNCILSTNCAAFKLGTESGGGFKNITVTNCTVFDRKIGRKANAGIALESVDGAEIEGITISNISMANVGAPILLRLGNRGRDMEKPTPGYLKDVIISNIVVRGATMACHIAGIPGHYIENILLDNIRINFTGGGSYDGKIEDVPEAIDKYPKANMFGNLPAYGLYCRHARNLKLQDLNFDLESPDKRYSVVCEDVEKLNIESFDAERSEENSSYIYFQDVKQAMIRGCVIPKDISAFIKTPENQKDKFQIIDSKIIQE